MTIRPTFLTKQLSSALSYSPDVSTHLWAQPVGKGGTLTTAREPGGSQGAAGCSTSPQARPHLPRPPPYSLLGTTDKFSVSHKVPHKLSLSLPLRLDSHQPHRQGILELPLRRTTTQREHDRAAHRHALCEKRGHPPFWERRLRPTQRLFLSTDATQVQGQEFL